MSNSSIVLLYDKILDNKLTIKLINFGTVALFIDYFVSLFKLAWPHILQYEYQPLLWKMEADGEHHVIDILALIGLYGSLTISFKKAGIKMWGLFALYFWYVLVSFHEEAWYISYAIAYSNMALPMFEHASLWIPDFLVIITFFIFYKITSKSDKANIRFNIPYKFFIVLSITYIIWILIGFPVTVDFFGYTAYYYSNFVNALEIFVWIISIIAFKTSFKVWNPTFKPIGVNKS